MNRATIERPLVQAVNAWDYFDIGFKAWKARTILDELACCLVAGCWAVRCDVFWAEGVFRYYGLNWDWVAFPAILFCACMYWRFWVHRTLVQGREYCVCPKVRPWLAMLAMAMAVATGGGLNLACVVGVVGLFLAVIL